MAKNSCQKKPKISEILRTKVVQLSCFTKLIEIKNVLLNWYSPTKFFSGKIRMIFDVKNRLWKSDFGIFGHLISLIKNQCHICDQCNYDFNLKGFYQIPLTWWKTYFTAEQWMTNLTKMKIWHLLPLIKSS